MAMQPGMVPLPAFGAAADPEVDKDVVDEYGVDRAERDPVTGELIGGSDRDADAGRLPDERAEEEQGINESALDSFVSGEDDAR